LTDPRPRLEIPILIPAKIKFFAMFPFGVGNIYIVPTNSYPYQWASVIRCETFLSETISDYGWSSYPVARYSFIACWYFYIYRLRTSSGYILPLWFFAFALWITPRILRGEFGFSFASFKTYGSISRVITSTNNCFLFSIVIYYLH